MSENKSYRKFAVGKCGFGKFVRRQIWCRKICCRKNLLDLLFVTRARDSFYIRINWHNQKLFWQGELTSFPVERVVFNRKTLSVRYLKEFAFGVPFFDLLPLPALESPPSISSIRFRGNHHHHELLYTEGIGFIFQGKYLKLYEDNLLK